MAMSYDFNLKNADIIEAGICNSKKYLFQKINTILGLLSKCLA